MSSPSPQYVDVSSESFGKEVLERSFEVPVVVDFWAPWCGPCRTLGPILERLIAETEGAVVLAKINTDECPELGQEYRIQGIPAVKAFRDGAVVSEFVGALPEAQLRQFLSTLIPTAADDQGRESLRLLAEGDLVAAEAQARAALAEQSQQPEALMALGEVQARRGEIDDAIASFGRITRGGHEAAATRRGTELELQREAAGVGTEDALAARLLADPADVPAHYGLGLIRASRGDHRAALESLLEVVRRDRLYGDDGGRKTMLKVFEMIGVRSDLADEFRGKLARLLF